MDRMAQTYLRGDDKVSKKRKTVLISIIVGVDGLISTKTWY